MGKRLGLHLLSKAKLRPSGRAEATISKVVLFDRDAATDVPMDIRLELLTGDISDERTMRELLSKRFDVIFHLAAIVSGEAESNFDLGMKVNLDATWNMLEIFRHLDYSPVFVFASSCAVFGGDFDMQQFTNCQK